MISQKHVSRNDSLRASQSPNLTPNWRPPRAPLPPHRLAKLANALGVSTPVPAGAALERSVSESASSVGRSPAPSRAASPALPSNPSIASRFLLQVVPPLTFPHDPDNDLPPPLSTASGYHTQFRRGILVPVYSSFQSQLLAIAKEYALPSTAGLILYLISVPPGSKETLDGTPEEPGPRLSDDIWRHIWTRVIQVEQRDDILPAPGLSRLKAGLASRSTPHLLDSAPSRPLISAPTPDIFNTSPSTPSTAFSHSKYVADSSPEDLETPDTSAPSNIFDAHQQAQSLDLPGLHSPSFIPILAKVEFDIDRRRAVWYEPWLRTRKANHAKRAENRAGKKGINDGGSEVQERQPPIQLIIGRQASPLPIHKQEEINDLGYQQLQESNGMEDEDGNSDEEAAGRVTLVTLVNGKDPLVDVFGTDGDTWADIHADNSNRLSANPSVVNLALTAADLSAMPDDSSQETNSPALPEEEEVRELFKEQSRPDSSMTATGVFTSPPSKRSSSTYTAKKNVPPPLVLVPKGQTGDLVIPSESSPMPSTPGSVGLAYLNGDSSPEKSPKQEDIEDEFNDQYSPIRTSTESEKRAGTIYDDLDLGLDPADDFDENDPNDRRRSQFLFRAKLDEIERTMAQLSPRILDTDLETDSIAMTSFSSKTPNSNPVSPAPGMLNVDYYPSSPFTRAPLNLEHTPPLNHLSPVQGPPRSSSTNVTVNNGQTEWPAVPFPVHDSSGNLSRTDGQPLPPQLAVNGVATSAIKSFVPPPSDVISAETERRKRELEEEYPTLAETSNPVPEDAAEDPVIPLSPDPFARYSSSNLELTTIDARLSSSSSQQWEAANVSRGSVVLEPVVEDDETLNALTSQGERSRSATVSRFSADSVTIGSEAAKPSMKTTLMTVRSIKKLWRKSNNKSSNTNNTPVPVSVGRDSPQVPPTRPERPSEETLDLPDVQHPLPGPPPNFKGYSSHPNSQPPVRMSQDQYRPSRTSTPSTQDQYSPSRPSYDQTGVPSAQAPQNLNVPQLKQSLQVPLSPNQGTFPPIPTNSSPSNHPQGLTAPPQNNLGGLNLPAFVGWNGNGSPIVAAQMLPRGASTMNRLQFDQESPYPLHMPNSPRYSPRAVSPPSLPAAQVPLPPSPAIPAMVPAHLQAQQQQSLPSPIPEKDKLTGRKSILKAFQKSKQSLVLPPTPTESRSSVDKLNQSPSTISNRPRRPSFHSTKSSMTSANDMPPSPHIPEQFLGDRSKNGVTSMLGAIGADDVKQQSRLTTSSTDSAISQRQYLGRSGSPPPLSMASSRSSIETRPGFDASQFEIVSPKTSTLTYPYHNPDHQ